MPELAARVLSLFNKPKNIYPIGAKKNKINKDAWLLFLLQLAAKLSDKINKLVEQNTRIKVYALIRLINYKHVKLIFTNNQHTLKCLLMQVKLRKNDSVAVIDDEIVFSHWDSWDAKEYLETYFSKLGQDSIESLKFIVSELKKFKNLPKRKIIDFGTGPTIFTGFAAAPYASKIDLCDYLEPNLLEIKKWINSHKDSFDWTHCIKYILNLEGGKSDKISIEKRIGLFKKTIGGIFRSDASLDWPIFLKEHHKYPIVISNFCADSATSSKIVWGAYMKNIINLVEDNGRLIITALHKCKFYKSGNKFFPSANISKEDMLDVLSSNGFNLKDLKIQIRKVPECMNEGFSAIICASATKLSNKQRKILDVFRKVSKESNVRSHSLNP